MGIQERNELNELIDLIYKIENDTAIIRLKAIVKDYLKKEQEKKQYL